MVLCLNVGILTVAGILGPTFPIHTPFNNNIINGTTLPNIYNTTNSAHTLIANTTTSVTNATNQGGFIGQLVNPIAGSFFFALNVVWTFIQFITGGFVFQVLGLFGFPVVFVYGLQAIFGIFLARSILYYLTGR